MTLCPVNHGLRNNFGELFLKIGQQTVLNFRHAREVAATARFVHVELEFFDLFLHALRALHGGLFAAQNFVEVGVFTLQFQDFFFEQIKALARRSVLLFLHRFSLNL